MASKPSIKLKPKSKAMADLLIDNPKMTKTDAYLKTHNTTNKNTARSESAKLTAKPSFQIYTQNQVELAKTTIVSIANNENAKDSDRINASKDILDRNEGKALIKQISESHNVNINVEANDQLATDFLQFIKGQTQPN